MKVSVNNLGALSKAEIILNPLTIFVGPNNSGKTWTAYTLEAILGPYGYNVYEAAYVNNKTTETYPLLDKAVEQILTEGNAKIDLVQFGEEWGDRYFNHVACLARTWLPKYFNTKRISFENFTAHLELAESKNRWLDQLREKKINRGYVYRRGVKEPLLTVIKEKGEEILYFYTQSKEELLDKLPKNAVRETVVENIFLPLHQALYYGIFSFPTERAFLGSYPMNKQGRGMLIDYFFPPEPQGKIRYPWPLSRFLFDISTLQWQGSLAEREIQAEDNPLIGRYIQLADILEKEILKGKVDFSTSASSSRREVIFQPTEGLSMEIPVASSMVKELFPLVLYLRYLAEPGHWIIIDEPEMNLHPMAQVAMIEFLAMVVQAEIHVLLTTHSPYLVDHLINLMKAAKLMKMAKAKDKEAIRHKFFLKDPAAFISKDQVSVYLFENGTAKNILSEDGLINWGTFGDISDRIANLYYEL